MFPQSIRRFQFTSYLGNPVIFSSLSADIRPKRHLTNFFHKSVEKEEVTPKLKHHSFIRKKWLVIATTIGKCISRNNNVFGEEYARVMP